MWLQFNNEEITLLNDALDQCKLHGFKHLLYTRITENSPVNPKHTQTNAVKAANTYFSANDLIIDQYVKWEENGDALVMCWQKVPQSYIEEGCGCGK